MVVEEDPRDRQPDSYPLHAAVPLKRYMQIGRAKLLWRRCSIQKETYFFHVF
jgi:hypothetical protein